MHQRQSSSGRALSCGCECSKCVHHVRCIVGERDVVGRRVQRINEELLQALLKRAAPSMNCAATASSPRCKGKPVQSLPPLLLPLPLPLPLLPCLCGLRKAVVLMFTLAPQYSNTRFEELCAGVRHYSTLC
jgi:hypothetical protein